MYQHFLPDLAEWSDLYYSCSHKPDHLDLSVEHTTAKRCQSRPNSFRLHPREVRKLGTSFEAETKLEQLGMQRFQRRTLAPVLLTELNEALDSIYITLLVIGNDSIWARWHNGNYKVCTR